MTLWFWPAQANKRSNSQGEPFSATTHGSFFETCVETFVETLVWCHASRLSVPIRGRLASIAYPFRRLYFPALMLGLLFGPTCALSFERYYLDNTPLYLYKTINWWYHSDPNEATFLCGKPVACRNGGNALFAYDAPHRRLKLNIHGGLAGLFAVFKQCRHCYGPTQLSCTWRNPKYLAQDTDISVLSTPSGVTGFLLDNITAQQATRIQKIQSDLQFMLEGVIGGLANGRIALHESGELLQNCRVPREAQTSRYPILLTLVNSGTNEILARFEMIWEE